MRRGHGKKTGSGGSYNFQITLLQIPPAPSTHKKWMVRWFFCFINLCIEERDWSLTFWYNLFEWQSKCMFIFLELARKLLPCPGRNKFPEIHIINSLFTHFFWSRWLDIVLVLFCEFMNHSHCLGSYKYNKRSWSISRAIVTSRLVDNPCTECYWTSGRSEVG